MQKWAARRTGGGDASLQLSVCTWNGGKWRGAMRSMEWFRMGAWHVVLGQEIECMDPEARADFLEKQPAKKKRRAAPYPDYEPDSDEETRKLEQLASMEQAGFTPVVRNWGMVGLRGRQRRRGPHCGGLVPGGARRPQEAPVWHLPH